MVAFVPKMQWDAMGVELGRKGFLLKLVAGRHVASRVQLLVATEAPDLAHVALLKDFRRDGLCNLFRGGHEREEGGDANWYGLRGIKVQRG